MEDEDAGKKNIVEYSIKSDRVRPVRKRHFFNKHIEVVAKSDPALFQRHRFEMRRLCVFLFSISATFGLLPAKVNDRREFTYPDLKLLHNQLNPHDCTICDLSSCLRMDNAMCEYHRAAGEILKEENTEITDENPALKAEVDDLLFEIAKDPIVANECTPYISHYTNCHKHNICLGCRKCDCNAAGMWNCTKIQQCRSDAILDVNHRVLVEVMENLNAYETGAHVRKKRSKNNTTVSKADEGDERLTLQEIMTLINGPNYSNTSVKNVENDLTNITSNIGDRTFDNETIKNDVKNSKTISNDIDDPVLNNDWESAIESAESTVFTNVEGSELKNVSDLDFNELLPVQNILTDGNSTTIYLPMLKRHTEDILDPDYMDIRDETMTQSNDINKTDENMLGSEGKYFKESSQNSTQKEEKKMIFYIDLGKDFKARTNFPKEDGASDNDDTNDIFDKQTVHIVKRETTNVIPNDKIPVVLNYSNNSIYSLKEELFDPLSYVITEKREELKKLEQIRNNIMKLIKTHLQNETYQFSHEMLNNSNTAYLTVYKLELDSNLDKNTDNLTEPTYLDDYAFKLENDIYEVIKDIVEIQKNSHFKILPDDLKVLIRAMKYYVHKQGQLVADKEIKNLSKISENVRRKSYSIDTNKIFKIKATDIFKQLLNAIDQDMPLSNALAPLSIGAKKIIKRIIKKYYRNEFPISDLSDDITGNLKDIGTKWYKITKNIASSSWADKLFNMKLLHHKISRDICKIGDVLSLIEFVKRRHAFINEQALRNFASNITKDIEIIKENINIIRLQNANIAPYINNNTKTEPKPKKDSYLQRLKKILKHSKKNFKKLLTDKLKYLSKQRKDSESQSVQNINVEDKMNTTLTRRKRTVTKLTKIGNRIRNIIPNYLKGKVNVSRNSKYSITKL